MGSGIYVTVSRGVAQVSQFLVFVLAARMLSPAEFGVFSMASAVAILLVRLGDGGWREFVMTSKNPVAIDQTMTACLLASGTASLICFAVSASVGLLFDAPEMSGLFAIFGIWVPMASATAVHSGMMVRRGRLAALSLVQIGSETVGLAVTVVCLEAGMGVLALVYGRLAYQAVCLAGTVNFTRWFPAIGLDRVVGAELVVFSKHILASRLISYFRSYAARLAVGVFLGPASAGFFRAGERIVLALSEVLAETFQMIGWVAFRRSSEATLSKDETRSNLRRETSFLHPILLATSAPIFIGLAIVSDNLIETAFGPAWHPAALVVSVIAIRQLLVMPSFLSEPLLAIVGEVRRLPPIAAFNAMMSIVLVVLAGPFGIVAVAFGQLAAAFLTLGAAIWLQRRYAGISVAEICSRSAFILPATAALLAVVLVAEHMAREAGLTVSACLAIQVLSGGGAYALAVAVLQKLTRSQWHLLARPAAVYS